MAFINPTYSEAVESQPRGESPFVSTHHYQPPPRIPLVPPALEPLVEASEIILEKKEFQTRGGQHLFSMRRNFLCCGPPMNITLVNIFNAGSVSMHLVPEGRCCPSYPLLQVEAPPKQPIGYVKCFGSLGILNFFILDVNQECRFTSVVPTSLQRDKPIQILSANGHHTVVQIRREFENGTTRVVFEFPADMDAKMKAVILGAFLFVSFRLRGVSSSNSYTPPPAIGDSGDWASSWGDCIEDFGGDDGGDCGGDGGGDGGE
ncbi:phospholipid scramblase 1-like [Spea bombifrons]|uniref:phospholipid scramblase 1-like n=1 Tax=Spea bombifrons TaxID=233779 RepID=UPI00234A414E|nr:phospholipid scramblase 1-like [Spea bombifrons]